jgi:hypothetical protein
MKLTSLVSLTGDGWVTALEHLDGMLDDLHVDVREEKECRPGPKKGTYTLVTVGYDVAFVSGIKNAKKPRVDVASLHLRSGVPYNELELDFHMHWKDTQDAILSAIYKEYDSRIEQSFFERRPPRQ